MRSLGNACFPPQLRWPSASNKTRELSRTCTGLQRAGTCTCSFLRCMTHYDAVHWGFSRIFAVILSCSCLSPTSTAIAKAFEWNTSASSKWPKRIKTLPMLPYAEPWQCLFPTLIAMAKIVSNDTQSLFRPGPDEQKLYPCGGTCTSRSAFSH
jgi:hypothetical protein